MTLQVIGAGWGRTGTFSLKLALERLGYGTHHMHEVFLHPEQSEQFLAAAGGGNPDWETIYGNCDTTVDWPGAAFCAGTCRHVPGPEGDLEHSPCTRVVRELRSNHSRAGARPHENDRASFGARNAAS